MKSVTGIVRLLSYVSESIDLIAGIVAEDNRSVGSLNTIDRAAQDLSSILQEVHDLLFTVRMSIFK